MVQPLAAVEPQFDEVETVGVAETETVEPAGTTDATA
jgi:hypothetical protein